MATSLISRNVSISGHRTSMRLEPEMWDALHDICEREKMNVHEMCSLVDVRRRQFSLTSAVRVFIIAYYKALVMADTEEEAVPVTRPLGFDPLGDALQSRYSAD